MVLEKAVDPWEKVALSKFKLKEVRGDGHCAFRAIVQGINRGGLSQEAESTQAKDLRKLAVKELYARRGDDLRAIGLTVDQLVTIDPDGKYDNFFEYVRGMSGTDFAGEVELHLLAEKMKRAVFVYRKESDHYRRMAKYGKLITNCQIHVMCD